MPNEPDSDSTLVSDENSPSSTPYSADQKPQNPESFPPAVSGQTPPSAAQILGHDQTAAGPLAGHEQPVVGHFPIPDNQPGPSPLPQSLGNASSTTVSPSIRPEPLAASAQPQPGAPTAPNAAVPNPAPANDLVLPPLPTATGSVSPPQSSVVVSPFGSQGKPVITGTDKPKKGLSKKLGLIIAAAIVVLGGGSVAAYHEYLASPNVIWSQSLGNMNKGYSNLIGYVNTQSNIHYHGIKETGSVDVTASGQSYSGTMSSETYGVNSTSSIKADLGVANLDLEARTVAVAGASEPDVYVQLSGIKSLGSYLGADLTPPIASLDGQWILIDHNLLTDLENEAVKSEKAQSSSPTLTWAEIYSFLLSAGKVNKQYVFTANPSTAVMTVLKKYGTETVDGNKTYHYKVGFVKAHVKAYITAMCTALQQSNLGGYINQVSGQSDGLSTQCVSMEKSTDQIKASDTIDVWANEDSHLIYKIRISDSSNPAENFTDIGLNYKSGDSFPFFISGQDKADSSTTTYSIVATLNTKSNTLSTTIQVKDNDSSSPFSLTGNFSFKPNNTALNISVPAGAESITDVLSKLGLSQYLTELQSLGSNSQTALNPINISSSLKLVSLFVK